MTAAPNARRFLRFGSLALGAACTAAGCAFAGQWLLAALAGLAGLGSVLAPRRSLEAFLGLTGLAAAGVAAGAAPPLMICSAVLALAAWDLADWEAFAADGLSGETAARLDRKHFSGLVLSAGAGLLIALLGRLIIVDLPFGVAAVVAALLLLGVDQVWRFVSR
jgi:hypothetical protein